MRKIVAIGGKNLELPKKSKTFEEIISLCDEENPSVLFIPSAANDNTECIQRCKESFSQNFPYPVNTLLLMGDPPPQEEIEKTILSSDIIYIGPGNSLKMMRKWRFLKIASMLKKASEQGIVLCGTHAGAVCWFAYGHTDSMSFYSEAQAGGEWEFIRVKCLGIIDRIMLNPMHSHKAGKESFLAMVKKMGGIGIGLEDNIALVVKGNEFKLVKDQANARGFKIFKEKSHIVEKEIPCDGKWRNFNFLLRKF